MSKKNKKNARRERFEFTNNEIQRVPLDAACRRITVYVEGYEDVAFWRGVFDDFESDEFIFEITVPLREDLAKGKRVVMNLAEQYAGRTDAIFCVDSDFDYLFANQTEVSRTINNSPNIFHTYAYAADNYLCYAPSLHNICVKATKNDMMIFDFERFFAEYSKIIYPLFVWYAYSAQIATPNIFPLVDFKSSVKINYLEIENNGAETLAWLKRQVSRRVDNLRRHYPYIDTNFPEFKRALRHRGVRPENTYMFMQGHTLMDNVVMPVLDAVCDKLRCISVNRIKSSKRTGTSLVNEQSNYTNALQNIRNAIMFNENYKDSFLYKKLKKDIQAYLNMLHQSPAFTKASNE